MVLFEKDKDVAIIRLSADTVEGVLAQMQETFDILHRWTDCKGVVFLWDDLQPFRVHDGLDRILVVPDAATCGALVRRMQVFLAKIEKLPIVRVWVAKGMCSGIGCEMSLCCHYRVMLNDQYSRIGFSDIKIGMVPIGGIRRLLQIVGLSNALTMLVEGQLLNASDAFSLGLIDKTISPREDGIATDEALIKSAKSLIYESLVGGVATYKRREKGVFSKEWLLTNVLFGKNYYISKKRREIEHSGLDGVVKHNITATFRAIESCGNNSKITSEEVDLAHMQVVSELATLPEYKSSLYLYNCVEASKRLGATGMQDICGARIVVIGSNCIAVNIITEGVLAGHDVVVILPDGELSKVQLNVQEQLATKSGYKLREWSKVEFYNSIESAKERIQNCAIVIETNGAKIGQDDNDAEDFDEKQRILRQIASKASLNCIIATTTAYLPITILSETIPNPQRMVGFYADCVMQENRLAEIVCSSHTGDRAIALSAAFMTGLGRLPVVVQDVPGFLVNRLLAPYLLEALHALAEGLSIKEIDASIIDLFGMQFGPFQLLDKIGLDVGSKVLSMMQESYVPRMAGGGCLARFVEAGFTGKQAGAGFYSYSTTSGIEENYQIYELLDIEPSGNPINAEDIKDRLIFAIINEAVRCLDEQVAGLTGSEAAAQIDLASVMAIGFPLYRGGVIKYADECSAGYILKQLMKLTERYGDRFSPVKGICYRAEHNMQFGVDFYSERYARKIVT